MGTSRWLSYTPLSKKDLHKQNLELIELHKRCIKTYLVSKSLDYPTRKKFFAIYDYYITEDNIIHYFFLPIKYFVISIILHKLRNIKFYGKRSV